MASPHVLVVGGHGKIAMRLTPMLLSRSWSVTSLIRDPAQESEIKELGKGQPGKLNVLVSSVEEIQSEAQAKSVLDKVGAPWVVWSAGGGGRGGEAVTHAVDNVAAKAFISASTHSPGVTHFLMVSHTGSRRTKPSWWTDAAWAETQDVVQNKLRAYSIAKLAADECMTSLATTAPDYAAICLRPGLLTMDPAGPVNLGKIEGRGKVSREGVAAVIAGLFDKASEWQKAKCTWLDLLDGEKESVEQAVQRVLSEKVDTSEGEDLDLMKNEAKLA